MKLTPEYRMAWYAAHPLYSTWCSMRSRCRYIRGCNNPYTLKLYEGVKICDEWLDYATFESWCLENGWKKGLHVARKDKAGDFTPENCVVVPQEVNINMRRNTLRIDGVPLRTIIGTPTQGRGDHAYRVIRDRIRKRWDVNSALNAPMMTRAQCGQITCRIIDDRRKANNERKEQQ